MEDPPVLNFHLYKIEEPLKKMFYGQIENIGSAKAKLSFNNSVTQQNNYISIKAADHNEAAGHLIDWLEKQESFDSIKAIGHRIVHGMKHTEPECDNSCINQGAEEDKCL